MGKNQKVTQVYAKIRIELKHNKNQAQLSFILPIFTEPNENHSRYVWQIPFENPKYENTFFHMYVIL